MYSHQIESWPSQMLIVYSSKYITDLCYWRHRHIFFEEIIKYKFCLLKNVSDITLKFSAVSIFVVVYLQNSSSYRISEFVYDVSPCDTAHAYLEWFDNSPSNQSKIWISFNRHFVVLH
jgi:hypothetical protein